MQGPDTLARLNAELTAVRLAQKAGVPHYVINTKRGRYEITTLDPGKGKAVFVGHPDFPVEI